MPLVNCKCTSCGGTLQISNDKDAAICPYCGDAFIVEKAINNFNISTPALNMDGAVINVGETFDVLYSRFETFIKLENWFSATQITTELINKFPMDYRSWIACVIAETHNYLFYFTKNEKIDDKRVMHDFEAAEKVAFDNQIADIEIHKQKYEKIRYKVKNYEILGERNARICNEYDVEDLEKALGCTFIKKTGGGDEIEYNFSRILCAYEHYVIYELHGFVSLTIQYGVECSNQIDDVTSLLNSYQRKVDKTEYKSKMKKIKKKETAKNVLIFLGIGVLLFLFLGIFI